MGRNKNGHKNKSSPISASPIDMQDPVKSTSSTGNPSRQDNHTNLGNIIVEQNLEMQRQDEQLVDLEASISSLRDASLTINQEVTLQSRLLDEVHASVDRVQDRQVGTQDRLRHFIRRSGTCKLWMLVVGLLFVLVLLLSVLK